MDFNNNQLVANPEEMVGEAVEEYEDNMLQPLAQQQNRSRQGNLNAELRIAACNREKARTRAIKQALDSLRSLIPHQMASGKKCTRIECLRMAIKYILDLQRELGIPTTSSPPPEEEWASAPRKRKSGQTPFQLTRCFYEHRRISHFKKELATLRQLMGVTEKESHLQTIAATITYIKRLCATREAIAEAFAQPPLPMYNRDEVDEDTTYPMMSENDPLLSETIAVDSNDSDSLPHDCNQLIFNEDLSLNISEYMNWTTDERW